MFWNQPKKTNSVVTGAVSAPDDIAKTLGASKTNTKGVYTIAYQGGNFVLNFMMPDAHLLNVIYPSFYTFAPDKTSAVLLSINEFNKRSRLWRISMHEDSSERLSLTLSCGLFNVACVEQMVYDLKTIMTGVFEIARDFNSVLQKNIESGVDADALIRNMALGSQGAAYQRAVSMGYSEAEPDQEFPRTDALSVSSIIDASSVNETGALLNLRVVCGDSITSFASAAEMLDFNVRTFVKEQPDPRAIESILLELTFEYTTIVATLRKLTISTDKVLYFNCSVSNTTAVFLGVKDDTQFLSTIEIRLERDENKDYWEAKYIWDDARDKVENNQQSELTDEQRWILSLRSANFSEDLYWGKRFLNTGCYIQALWHFRRVMDKKIESWSAISDEERDDYCRVAQLVAHIYLCIGKPDRAYALLSLCIDHVRDQDTLQMVANSLCLMRDPRAIDFLVLFRKETANLIKKAEDSEDPNEAAIAALEQFMAFFDKRILYMLVLTNDLDEAVAFAKDMVEHESPEADYAMQKLNYIKMLKGEIEMDPQATNNID